MKSRTQLRFTGDAYPLETKIWVIPPQRTHQKAEEFAEGKNGS